MNERFNKLVSQAESIRDAAKAQERDLTADELAQIQTKLDEADSIKAEMELLERLDNQTQVAAPKSASKSTRKTESVKPAYENDPKKGFASSRDFLIAVRDAAIKPHAVKDNLKSVMAVSGDGHHTYSDPNGGFLVPSGFLPDVLQVQPEADPMAGRTTMIPMATPTVKIPYRVDKNHTSSVSGGLQVYRRREEATITKSQMTLGQLTLDAHKLTGLAYATEEMLEDSAVSITGLISTGFNQEFTSKLIDERLNGTGVGEFLGVFNSPALISVAKEGSQTADTIAFENIIKMRSRVWGYGQAVWMANHDTIPQLCSIEDTEGRHIFLPSLRDDVPDTLLGRPIIFTEYVPTLGDANDLCCVNWSQYLEGMYQPVRGAESVHVRFTTDERAFKFGLRNDGKPWWDAALTPKNSSNTLSPYVGLAERA